MTRPIVMFVVSALTLARPIPAAEPVSLQSLRDDVALHWFDAEPHLRLAKYHRDHGNPLLGFYISEYTRRVLSEEAAFDAAHRRVFVDRTPFDNSAKGEARVAAQLAEAPESVDLLMKLADIHISRSSWEDAAPAKRTRR